MRHAARVTMSMRELDRLKCIQAVVDGQLCPGIAAERLGYLDPAAAPDRATISC